MIEWIGRNTEGKVIGTMTAKDMRDLFTKLNAWVRDDSTSDYLNRDLMVKFLSKKEPKLAKLGKDIEKQTGLIYKTIDMLESYEVVELILFAKRDTWVRNDSISDYFDRDLMVKFLSKKEPKLAKLGKDIDQQTDLIYNTVDMLDDEEVKTLIEFAGEADKNEFIKHYRDYYAIVL